MLRSTCLALAIAGAVASQAAAVSLPHEPCVRDDDQRLELHRPTHPAAWSHGVTFSDDAREHRHSDHHGRNSHDFDHDGSDDHGHPGDGCTPVPEPTTLALLTAAATLLIARPRSR